MTSSCKKNNKLSAEEEPHDNIEFDIDIKNIYQIYNMSIDDQKENIEWRKCAFQWKIENTYEIEIHNSMTCIHEKK